MIETELPPLFKESIAYVNRLKKAVGHFDESNYRFARRLNWSYRFSDRFLNAEARLFKSGPEKYLEVLDSPEPVVEDVFTQSVSIRKTFETLLKVTAHWLFICLGQALAFVTEDATNKNVYRKCFVDDIENLYDPDEAGVMRFVFPFPLNIGRQWRYVRYLSKRNYPFRFEGYRYELRTLLRFLWKRDVRSLERLERRAQVRLGRSIRRSKNWDTIQLSDDYEICSIDFSRSLKKTGSTVVNRAHGVGKYFPAHAYQQFYILTEVQRVYYIAQGQCKYTFSSLKNPNSPEPIQAKEGQGDKLQFVFVSQTSKHAGAYLQACEDKVLEKIAREFGNHNQVVLWIKPHPNRAKAMSSNGFKILDNLDQLAQKQNVFYLSFYSTSHIDPSFVGERYLLSFELIRPEIAFDDDGSIIQLGDLKSLVEEMLVREDSNSTNDE